MKEVLIRGYTVNQTRLHELQQTDQLIQKSIGEQTDLREAKGLLEIISQYTQSFVLSNQFDSNSIHQNKLDENITYEISYSEAKVAITTLKQQLKEKKKQPIYLATKKIKVFRER